MPPAMLINALEGIRRRVKWMSVAFGLGITLSAGVGSILFLVLADYLLNLPPVPRIVLSLLAATGVLYVAARWVIKPAISRLTLGDVAGRLDRAFPQFDDRLRSTVDFSRGDASLGSGVMQQRVVSEAADLATRIDLRRALVTTPLWCSSATAIGAIALLMLLALFVVSPLYTQIAISRLLAPFSGAAWPKTVQIELLSDVPARVPVGERIEMKMRLAKGDRASTRARIYYQINDGPIAQEFMTRAPDGTYTAALDARSVPNAPSAEMKIWMVAGDDRHDVDPIAVLPRLAIHGVDAVIMPPSYVGATAPTNANLEDGAATVAAGSDVTLRVAFNKALIDDEPVRLKPVNPDHVLPTLTWQRQDSRTIAARFVATTSLRFNIEATDTDGFRNSALEEYELLVRPDQNPTVQIEHPRRNEERTPVAVVPLVGVAEDDYGINSLKLVVERLRDQRTWEIDLVKDGASLEDVSWQRIDGSGDRLRFRSHYAWDLAKLDAEPLNPGDILEYHLLVQDNYNFNGATHEPVPSGKLRITIVSQEQFSEIVTNELRLTASQIRDLHTRQLRQRQETLELASETRDKPQFDEADLAIAERLIGQQGTVASQSRQIANKLEALRQRMDENRSPSDDLRELARDVRDLLNNAAENPMKSTSAQISLAARQLADPDASPEQQKEQTDERNRTMEQAADNQQLAADQLQTALDRLGSVGSLAQTIERIRNLLAEQRRISKETTAVGNANLGKRPEQMTPADRQRLERAADEQQALSAKTERELAEMDKLAEQLSKTDPTSAEAMRRASSLGQSQQVSPNQSRAAQQARQNQQQSAQAAQKQAELGLELMLNELRQAERHKLEELARRLAELQEQIENLIRRQAGHNLDNLALQDRIATLTEQELEALLAYSKRTPDHPVTPLPQLTTAQELTERNTRDIARRAQELPSGAEPSSHLTRAAGRMERAIIALRKKDLPGAYEPPQVEALASLLEAARIIDEQKQQVDDRLDQQQREAIRAVYIEVKEQQEKLNAETIRLDKAPRLGDGDLRREDKVRLGQLPGEQEKLAQRLRDLEEDLSALGSIVYIWANNDIVSSMELVRDLVTKPDTSDPTQEEQARVVEQLDAMINSLKIEPVDPRFAERSGGGGGGGGGGGTRLPAEAELRLLKELQLAINKTTKSLDARPQKDEVRLVALGGRQGDIRDLLDRLLQQSTQGQMKLRPEPDNRDMLPEEAGVEDIENQELEDDLLGQISENRTERDLHLVGDRMARSRQRLALNNDPGEVTQLIQERIVIDIDKLIDEARAQACAGGGAGQPQQKPGIRPGNQQANRGVGVQQAGANPADRSTAPGPAATQLDISQEIAETAAEWGHISPRLRDAVIEGSTEQIIEKYRRFVEDYYKGLSQRGTDQP